MTITDAKGAVFSPQAPEYFARTIGSVNFIDRRCIAEGYNQVTIFIYLHGIAVSVIKIKGKVVQAIRELARVNVIGTMPSPNEVALHIKFLDTKATHD